MKRRALAAPFVVTIALAGCEKEEIHRNPPPLPPTPSETVTVTTNPPAIVEDAGAPKVRATPSVPPMTHNPPPTKPSL